MAVFLQDCPHCGARHATFTVRYSDYFPNEIRKHFGVAICPACHFPLAFIAVTNAQMNIANHNGVVDEHVNVINLITYPERQVSQCPESVPESAAKAYVQGAESLADKRTTAAVAMFRRTIDVATKQFSDEVEAGNLAKRIDKLANANLITKDLQAWAHKIRLEGNQALHEIDEPTLDQAKELQQFTEMMLVYMFTLPAKIKANIGEAI